MRTARSKYPQKRGQRLFSNGLVLVPVRHGRVPAISGPRLTLIRLLPLAFSRPHHSGQATTSPFSATCHTHLERSFLRAIFNSLAIENIRNSLCRFTNRQVSIFLGAASYVSWHWQKNFTCQLLMCSASFANGQHPRPQRTPDAPGNHHSLALV
jgi:hypothetical protein